MHKNKKHKNKMKIKKKHCKNVSVKQRGWLGWWESIQHCREMSTGPITSLRNMCIHDRKSLE